MILSVDNSPNTELSSKSRRVAHTNPPPLLKVVFMKETFYHQIREFGILVERNRTSETWMVRGCSITIYFKDTEHHIIDLITL